ncbi:hypothetical protein LZT09_13995 [Vibrio fluvialis]|uniref:hypothetical protein n=1 Tax=Vibrio fluvialis TaxID=676 RepID=UPI001F4501C0|nr:hypothetical protein [Vibrio fluvialis]MCE7615740.1 hypothetical protein [Vibrio fluvialis]
MIKMTNSTINGWKSKSLINGVGTIECSKCGKKVELTEQTQFLTLKRCDCDNEKPTIVDKFNALYSIELARDELKKAGAIKNHAENLITAADFLQDQLTTITKQRDELARLMRLVMAANVDNYGKGVGLILNSEDSNSLRDLLSEIKEPQ